MRILPIIPARLESERFPGKLLKKYRHKAVVAYPAESCIKAFGSCLLLSGNLEIIEEIAEGPESACGPDCSALLMHGDYRNGTERIADACNRLNIADDTLIMHVQGDEVGLNPEDLKRLAGCAKYEDEKVSTLFYRTDDESLLKSRDHVKCMGTPAGWVFRRDPDIRTDQPCNIHVGVYCYRRDALRRYMQRWPTEDEKRENLEQLRWDVPIIAYEVAPCKSINTPEDLE